MIWLLYRMQMPPNKYAHVNIWDIWILIEMTHGNNKQSMFVQFILHNKI